MIKKTILLTGAGGMVGQNLLEHQDISSYDILTPRSSELDLRDFEEVKKYLKKYKPEMIIHAAAKVGGIQINIQEPLQYFVDNLDMGRNIIIAAHNTVAIAITTVLSYEYYHYYYSYYDYNYDYYY